MTTSQHFARQRLINEHKARQRALERFEAEQRCGICLIIGDWFKRAANYFINY